ncbi:MAG: hypothetical protein ABIH34_05155 [Nanoarchaeota archaeon]
MSIEPWECNLDGARIDREVQGGLLSCDEGRQSDLPPGVSLPPNVLRLALATDGSPVHLVYMALPSEAAKDQLISGLYLGQEVRLSGNDDDGFFSQLEIIAQPEEPEKEWIKL